MGKIAVVFPGQGSQAVGMGKDFYGAFESAKKIIDEANEILGFDLKTLMFEGPAEELTLTYNTQPALVAVSAAILAVLKQKGLQFQGAAGHSLGEYSAYAASEKLSFSDALKLVRKRGELMASSDPDKKGGMAAVMRMEDPEVEKICSKYPLVVPANYNCPGQLVISGDKAELEKVYEEIKAGGGRAMPLNVSGPFHSPLMKKAADEFEPFLAGAAFAAGKVPVYANLSAEPVENGKEKESLKGQITGSVRWTQTILNMVRDGFDTFIEVGSGKVLQGLIKKIHKEAKIYGVSELKDLESADWL